MNSTISNQNRPPRALFSEGSEDDSLDASNITKRSKNLSEEPEGNRAKGGPVPLVIAHRGFTSRWPENSLKAIEAALQIGVDGIEVDLRMTKDGTIVIFHDETLERLTGVLVNVEKTSWAELQKVRIGGEKIPTLEELLDLVGDRCLLNLEIKTVRFLPTHEQILSRILRERKLADSVILSTFNPLALLHMRLVGKEFKRGFLYEQETPLHPLVIPLLKTYSLHVFKDFAYSSMIERCHRKGKRFFVWTVNAENDMKEMIHLGVDGIITDHPDRLQRVLANGGYGQ